jgi:hypothetical protein
MALESAPLSTQSDGKWRITNVPSGSNAKSVAILNGGTATAITYGLTADGWNHSKSQATVEDKRLTMVQDLSRPGRITESLEIKAVASTDAASADAILSALAASGAESQFLVRRAVDNATTHTVGQKGDLLTGIVGVRRPDAPVENGVDTVSFTFYFTQPTQDQVTLVA